MGLLDFLGIRTQDDVQGDVVGPSPVACTVAPDELASPVTGQVVPLASVSDPVFSQGMMGPGVAVRPDGDVVFSPCSGVVTATVSTGHAVGIQADRGVEVLVHVGVDTVDLHGAGFTCLVRKGAHVACGQPVIAFDRAGIEARGVDDTVMLTCPSLSADGAWPLCPERAVAGEPLLKVCGDHAVLVPEQTYEGSGA